MDLFTFSSTSFYNPPYIKKSLLEHNMESFYQIPRSANTINKLVNKLSNLMNQEKELIKNMFPELLNTMMVKRKESDKISLFSLGRYSQARDDKGLYYILDWDNLVYIEYVELFSFYDLLEGTIVLSDGTEIQAFNHDSAYHISCYFTG